MLTILLSFLKNYKAFFIAGAIIVALLFSYSKGHIVGYASGEKDGIELGIKQEKARLDIEYNTLLAEKLKENADNLKKQFDLQLEAEKAIKKSDVEYKDRVNTVNKLIKEDPVKFDNTVCKEKLVLTDKQKAIVNRKE